MIEGTVISAWEAGWAIGILCVVLIGVGTGLGWFLKAYLRQQKEEFVARRKEQDRKDNLLMEQHGFIRDLATASMKETAAALVQMGEVRGFMQEMIHSLSIINEQLHEHAKRTDTYVPALQETAKEIKGQLTQLERTAFKSHGG